MLIFSMYIVGVVYNLLYCYLFCKCVLKEKFRISKRILIISCVLAVPLCLNFYYNKTPLKPFVSYLIEFIVIKLSYKESIIKNLSGILITFLLAAVSELIYAFITINMLGFTQEYLNETSKGFVLTNVCILLLIFIISNIKKVKSLLYVIINGFEERKIIISSILIVLCLSVVAFSIYENLSNAYSITYFIVINIFFISVYVFMIGFFVQKSNNNRLTSKYDQLIDYSKTYEQE